MEHLKEWIILWIVLGLSLGLLVYCLRKKPLTEWLLVFFLKAYIASLLNNFLIQSNYLEYPVRFLSKWFETSLVFDYFAFPVVCVLYNQTSYYSKWSGILIQAFIYSSVMTYIEYWLERETLVIQYHHWTWGCTLIFFILTFLIVRGSLGLVRKITKQNKASSP